MATSKQYQQQWAKALSGMSPSLKALIDAFPYYGDPDWEKAHRGALATLLAVNLPHAGIAPQPKHSDGSESNSYSYNGPYSGYADAFFHGIKQTSTTAAVAAAVQAVKGSLDGRWWGNYGVAVLTDAIRQVISLSLNTSKLATDLSNYNANFRPALSASYLAVFRNGDIPTATALNAISGAGQAARARSELLCAILEGQFTANINQAISMGGDSTNAAVWFLFNLWIALKALGDTDVDGDIRHCQDASLTVPSEVGPANWWNGGYTSWYLALSGSDLVSSASRMITERMPQQKETSIIRMQGLPRWQDGGGVPPPPRPTVTNIAVSNGYAQSLCYWGSLNWYKPEPSSCFGKGTGVLMADGSVKPIEHVRVGDEVRSSLGPKTVVLVESPRRSGRTLYQLNGLDVFATSAHPFRAAPESGPFRRAVDPWALIDAVPTMAAEGVGTLAVGARLAGLGSGDPKDVTVERLDLFPAAAEAEEYVYDLLLQSWEKGHAAYYVGGPQTFFAVDAETADPLHDPPSTLAVVAAMEVALPSCRQHVRDPVTELPSLLARLRLDDLITEARRATWSLPDGRLTRPSIPGPGFYMQNDQWDPHASTLEAYLVRQFGRMLRRESATGWRACAGTPSHGDHFVACVHDIGLLGEVPVPPDARVEIRLHLRGWTLSEDTVRTMNVARGAEPSWHLAPDEVVDFGRIHENVGPAALIGAVLIGGQVIGRFRVSVTEETLRGAGAEHFLFDPAGKVVGRIAIEQRRVAGRDLVFEKRRSQRWTHRLASATAINMGRQIGQRLVALIESESTRMPLISALDSVDSGTLSNSVQSPYSV